MNEGTAGIVPECIHRVSVYRCSSAAFHGAGLQHGGSALGGVAITLQSVKLCASEVFIGAEIAVSSRATPVERSFHDAFFHGIARGKEEEERNGKMSRRDLREGSIDGE